MSDETTTTLLARFSSALSIGEVPAEVLEHAAALIASTLARSRANVPDAALGRLLDSLASPADCTVLSSFERRGASYAAWANASAAAVGLVPGGFDAEVAALAVVPACLAAAEVAARPGPDLLLGVVAGVEVALRLAVALGAGHVARGFSALGSAGRLGAALGALRTLGHDEATAHAATGFACTEGAGPLSMRDAGLFALVAGRPAADGLEAALLAVAGLIGPPQPIEGRRGLFALEAASEPGLATAGLGERYLMSDATVNASGLVLDAARDLCTAGSAAVLIEALRG
jgi:2-methylcitrate dehydratase PrpD